VQGSRQARRNPTGVPIMKSADFTPAAPCAFELRFQSLFHEGRAYVFPCDSTGRVDIDALSQRARLNYLYARAMVGREVAMPAVLPTLH
jgi:hypothetical protein